MTDDQHPRSTPVRRVAQLRLARRRFLKAKAALGLQLGLSLGWRAGIGRGLGLASTVLAPVAWAARPKAPRPSPDLARDRPAEVNPSGVSRTGQLPELLTGLLDDFTALKLPPEAYSVMVQVQEEPSGKVLGTQAHGADRPLNPASVIKVFTAWAALEHWGPDHRFQTQLIPVRPRKGESGPGGWILKGGGDPKLLVEDLEAWMQGLMDEGLTRLEGSFYVDGSHFAEPVRDPFAFDGSGFKPYNAQPHAALLNLNSVALRANDERNTGRLALDPPLAETEVEDQTRREGQSCGPAELRYELVRPEGGPRLRVAGRLARRCPEGPLVYLCPFPDPAEYSYRLFAQTWRRLGGDFQAQLVREAPVGLRRSPLVWTSTRPLFELLQDVLQRSNNPMTRMLFLGLSRDKGGTGTEAHAARVVEGMLRTRGLSTPNLSLENGAGLSRKTRVSAQEVVRLLSQGSSVLTWEGWRDAFARVGETGTARKRQGGRSIGRAYVKTGSLEGVRALAGYVQTEGGRWLTFCVMVNHSRAGETRAALDRFLDNLASAI